MTERRSNIYLENRLLGFRILRRQYIGSLPIDWNREWHEGDGNGDSVGRSWYYKVEVTGPDEVTVHDWKNTFCGRSDISYMGDEINNQDFTAPRTPIEHFVKKILGRSTTVIYQASDTSDL